MHRTSRLSIAAVLALGLGAAVAASASAVTPPPPNQGGFGVRCDFSHSASADPIVMPGKGGMGHLHEFFGNTTTNENSTGASLLTGSTTCNDRDDLSAYWVPALYQDGIRIAPVAARVRYDVAPGTTTIALPVGFMAVAGRTNQSAAWGCAVAGSPAVFGTSVAVVPTCAPGSHLVAQVTFPSCWDGTSLDSANHLSHLADAIVTPGSAPVCPTGHPVMVPRVRLSIDYPTTATGGSGVTLASGSAATLHADIFEAWRGNSLQNRINAQTGNGGQQLRPMRPRLDPENLAPGTRPGGQTGGQLAPVGPDASGAVQPLVAGPPMGMGGPRPPRPADAPPRPRPAPVNSTNPTPPALAPAA